MRLRRFRRRKGVGVIIGQAAIRSVVACFSDRVRKRCTAELDKAFSSAASAVSSIEVRSLLVVGSPKSRPAYRCVADFERPQHKWKGTRPAIHRDSCLNDSSIWNNSHLFVRQVRRSLFDTNPEHSTIVVQMASAWPPQGGEQKSRQSKSLTAFLMVSNISLSIMPIR